MMMNSLPNNRKLDWSKLKAFEDDNINVVQMIMNSLPNDNFLDWSKLKTFADDESNLVEKLNLFWQGYKTLWKKEKMLVTSIFSFSHNVFKSLLSKVHYLIHTQ